MKRYFLKRPIHLVGGLRSVAVEEVLVPKKENFSIDNILEAISKMEISGKLTEFNIGTKTDSGSIVWGTYTFHVGDRVLTAGELKKSNVIGGVLMPDNTPILEKRAYNYKPLKEDTIAVDRQLRQIWPRVLQSTR